MNSQKLGFIFLLLWRFSLKKKKKEETTTGLEMDRAPFIQSFKTSALWLDLHGNV